MSTYIAPLRDMTFVLNEIAGLEEICALPGNEECSVELVESILDEAAKFATGVLDPINRGGDTTGSVCKDGVVTTAPGIKTGPIASSIWGKTPTGVQRMTRSAPRTASAGVSYISSTAPMCNATFREGFR